MLRSTLIFIRNPIGRAQAYLADLRLRISKYCIARLCDAARGVFGPSPVWAMAKSTQFVLRAFPNTKDSKYSLVYLLSCIRSAFCHLSLGFQIQITDLDLTCAIVIDHCSPDLPVNRYNFLGGEWAGTNKQYIVGRNTISNVQHRGSCYASQYLVI